MRTRTATKLIQSIREFIVSKDPITDDENCWLITVLEGIKNGLSLEESVLTANKLVKV